MRIEHSHMLAASAGASGFYIRFIGCLEPGDPNRVGYDEFKQQLFDCEFGERGGTSREDAITIDNAANGIVGVCAEYLHLTHLFGRRGRDWELEMQMLARGEGRTYDVMVVKLADGTTREVYYDNTSFLQQPPDQS